MLYYNRIDFSKGIAVNKTSESKECDICYYWHFLNKDFMFQANVCNRCYDLLIMSMNLNDFVILKIKGSYYCCIINRISKNEAINLRQYTNLTKKIRVYKFIITYKNGYTNFNVDLKKYILLL